jgi:sRNA-binding protein
MGLFGKWGKISSYSKPVFDLTGQITGAKQMAEEAKKAREKAEADSAAAKAEFEAKSAADAAALERRRIEKTKGGRNSTMLTAGMDEAAPVAKTTLGGY